MKLETLKTIESALNALIVAEETKIREARMQLEDALRDALNKPEIGRGKKLPTSYFDKNRLNIESALDNIEETFKLTESDEIKAECEHLFELFREYVHKQSESDNRIADLRAALKDFSSISWRE